MTCLSIFFFESAEVYHARWFDHYAVRAQSHRPHNAVLFEPRVYGNFREMEWDVAILW